MSLKTAIRTGVGNAFAALGDLVETAVFEEEVAYNFKFASGELDSDYEPFYVEMIPVESSTKDGSTVRTQFVARSADLEVSKYSTFKIGETEYRIEGFQSYEGAHIIETTRTTNV